MKKLITGLLFLLAASVCFGQVKEAFAQQLVEDSAKRDFADKLLVLDRLVGKGVEAVNVDSLQKEPGFAFVEKRTINEQPTLMFNVTWSQKTVYQQLEDAGKIKRLQALRLAGKLKIVARGIANEVELPKKTKPQQSYNDFYLEVIQKLLRTNEEIVKADKLDFATYQSWEKEANLTSPAAIRQYRESFILFLYKHYNL